MRWRAATVAFLLLVAMNGWADGEGASRLQTLTPRVLRIGTYFVNPPFEYLAEGKRVGFEVDLMNGVAGRLRLRPVFIDTKWEVILRQMEDHDYDCIVGGITITRARQEKLAWSDPYMTTTLSLVVNSAKTPQIRSLADLKEATVGVQAATTDYDAALAMRRRGEIKGVEVYPFDRIGNAMTDLIAGRITAVLKVYPVAAWLTRRSPDLRIVAQVSNDPQPLGIGMEKNNPVLLGAVNGALSDMKHDGTYARLAREWGVP
ncbi:MAG: amino acid ABC transporter substrate-binding protein [Alphaproteobacteria bacterium]|nr:amino acid ABC transporter substrate-binding protein [Alphaproteobacteria bacterium]